MKWDPVASLANLRHEEIASLFDFLENTQFWIKDGQGRYLRVNRAFHLNYSIADPADVVGLTDFDLSPPYLRDCVLRNSPYRNSLLPSPRCSTIPPRPGQIRRLRSSRDCR